MPNIIIPPEIQIRATIKEGTIYYFKEETFVSEEPHFFVILNRNPLTDEVLILVNATTQIQKRELARRGLPSQTLVRICPTECPVLREESLFDCNSITEKSLDSLVEKLSNDDLKICTQVLSEDMLLKLKNGVLESPLTKRSHKKLIRNTLDSASLEASGDRQ